LPSRVRPEGGGGTTSAIVSNLDFAETFLEAAGLPIPGDMQGRSLVPILKGEQPADWRTSFYYHYYEYPEPHHVRPHHGVVTDRYKLVRFEAPDLNIWELFDLETDPQEIRNVYTHPAYAATVTELSRELQRLRAELKVPDVTPREATGN
jgi:arylsulfatase A-like enzyme